MATVNCIEYANTVASPPVMNAPNTRGKLVRQRFSYTVGTTVAAGTVIVLGVIPMNARFFGGKWSNDAGWAAAACIVSLGIVGTPAKFHAGITTTNAVDETAFGVTAALGGSGLYVPTADTFLIATTADQVIVAAGTCWGWFDYVLA